MSWDGRINVQIGVSPDGDEISFVISHMEGYTLTPQMIIDAVADVIMQEWGAIPVRKFEDLDG